eukprot:SAG11_NODE_5839_length_1451_cov_1.141272_2_plen_50_part_00
MSVVASCRRGSRFSGSPQVEYPGEYLHTRRPTKISLLRSRPKFSCSSLE